MERDCDVQRLDVQGLVELGEFVLPERKRRVFACNASVTVTVGNNSLHAEGYLHRQHYVGFLDGGLAASCPHGLKVVSACLAEG